MKQVKFLMAAALLAFAPMARAEISLGEVVGTTYSIVHEFVGTTTLTPAYVVESWNYHLKQTGWTNGDYVSVHYKCTRNRITGLWKFEYRSDGGRYGTNHNTEVFEPMHINKLNINCTYPLLVNGVTNMIHDTQLESHTEWVYMKDVQRTGFVPDDGPWRVFLKTQIQKIKCSGNVGPNPNYTHIDADIPRSGGKLVSLGVPNSILQYPFYLTDDFYK